jgi:hypothetical protein
MIDCLSTQHPGSLASKLWDDKWVHTSLMNKDKEETTAIAAMDIGYPY